MVEAFYVGFTGTLQTVALLIGMGLAILGLLLFCALIIHVAECIIFRQDD